ncbi:MAG: hypothetical protein B7Y07_07535 [Halothiobacillus sp. 24-54-40]|nr:MAG: hypothetical protein B7Y58_11840 [Halothiobacillus sp. 35-54-62]OYZ86596.1 MAG: hypothetical protein B7Y07_07535 [Halothiobacillus sp. 24-54-40]OZA79980.1 MAG: hypothetical protein B7X64_07690 [Halothiobacillus sp. 39-53-45]
MQESCLNLCGAGGGGVGGEHRDKTSACVILFGFFGRGCWGRVLFLHLINAAYAVDALKQGN